MITGKQRAYLRKMAHQLEPIFQIGKEGVTDAFIDGLNKALTKREILKVQLRCGTPWSGAGAGNRK